MTETPESRTELTATATERPNILSQIAVWVGLVAGVVFIVAVIFFSGLFIGSRAHFDRGYHGDDCGMYHHGQMMAPGGMMGPGQMGPGQQQRTETPAVPTTPPR